MTAKTFDAVELMRELRDKLSQDMEGMTPQERLRFIRDKAAGQALGRRNAQDTAEAVQ
ncbi:MAG: hypothetical protein HY815_22235 [Candidatus Riflebacteria bacterium]|nr:hypothetical protein [Candidatus Riflebacteria bacterium]